MFNKLQPSNLDKKRIQTKEQVLYNMAYILDHFPQYRIAQHLVLLMRRRTTKGPDVFDWSDEEFLSKLEKYKDELDNELSKPIEETE